MKNNEKGNEGNTETEIVTQADQQSDRQSEADRIISLGRLSGARIVRRDFPQDMARGGGVVSCYQWKT